MTLPPRIKALERRLRYEEKQAARAPDDEARERHVVRYMTYERRYANLTRQHYIPQEANR